MARAPRRGFRAAALSHSGLARDPSPVSVVYLNGELVPAARAALSIADPAVRYGEGLFETMRAEGGRVPWLARHLARLEASTTALELAPMPRRDEAAAAVERALAANPGAHQRVRLTASPHPTLLVEVSEEPPRFPLAPGARALSVPHAWHPGRALAEHKTLSYGGYRRAQAAAAAAGAAHALLLDAEGRLGEAAVANAFCVLYGTIVTAPPAGLLPGVTRAAVIEVADVRQEALDDPVWRTAEELFLTNAVAGVIPVTHVDDRPVGTGRVGPVTRDVAAALAALAA